MTKDLPILTDSGAARSQIGFDEKLRAHNLELRAAMVDTLQINVGKLCNQACKHCHVDASPTRREIMPHTIVEQIAQAIEQFQIPTLDITGGAPELNALFRYLVERARAAPTPESLCGTT